MKHRAQRELLREKLVALLNVSELELLTGGRGMSRAQLEKRAVDRWSENTYDFILKIAEYAK